MPYGQLGCAAATAAAEKQTLIALQRDIDPTDDAALREKETALVDLGKLYRDQKCVAFALEARVYN